MAHPGDAFHIAAEQGRRDVAVTLFDPAGRQLLKIDSYAAAEAPQAAEEVYGIAETAGEYRVEVELQTGPEGPCPLRLVSLRPATQTDRKRARAETALARAHALRRASRYREAVAPYREAERRFRALGLRARRAEALYALGLLYKEKLEENKPALSVLAAALPLYAGDAEAEANVRQNLGEVRRALGDLDGAIRDFRRAFELRQRLGLRTDAALSANTLGLTLHLRGNYDEAASSFDRALALWQEGDDAGKRAQTLLNRGRLHLDLGERERARQRFREALRLYQQASDRKGQAVTLTALGIAALDEDPGQALAPLSQALALREPGSHGQAVTWNTLGVAYRRLHRLEDARKAYVAALPIFLRSGDLGEQARTLQNLGRLEAETGHDDPALSDFEQASLLYTKLGNSPELAATLRDKAEVLRRGGRLEASLQAMEAALSVVEEHRVRQQSHTTRAAFFATQQGAYDFLVDLLMEMHRRQPSAGYDARALERSEGALARSLLDALGSGARLRGADLRLDARERGLEAAIDSLVARQTRLAQNESADARRQLREIDGELARSWEELTAVRAELRAKSPRYAALTQPQPASAGQIARLLDRDTLLLEYRLGEPRSFLWAVTSESRESFELPGRAELEKRLQKTAEILGQSFSRQKEIEGGLQLAKLSAVLLGPVADRLPGKRVLVVGDGPIQTLPFAALPEPQGGEPLVAQHEVVSLPSASVLLELRREIEVRRSAPRSLWVLADPDFGDAFPPLPYSRQEAEAILALAPPGGRAAELLGIQASREAVVGGRLRDYRVLHFATHNSFTADPEGGRLVLAQVDGRRRRVADGFLRLADIYGLDLKADLVVLSACQSGLGREVRGEGLVGMTRGFFYAGAPRVLVSLWNVDDRVTVELMRRFYHGLFRQGLSPAAALREAQDEIRLQERWRSPYYWAGFVLQGEWRKARAEAKKRARP